MLKNEYGESEDIDVLNQIDREIKDSLYKGHNSSDTDFFKLS